MKRIISVIVILIFGISLQIKAQEFIPLYPGGVPDPAKSNEKADAYAGAEAPTLQVFLPEKGKETKTAVIVFPGGAYMGLAYQEEGSNIGQEFAKRGVAAFVVKYRLPIGYRVPTSKAPMSGDRYLMPLEDAQQAIKEVRMNAAKWNVDTGKIGIIGFSAGGHVASSLGTHFKQSYIPNKERTNPRPDFMILVYPVISMQDSLTHAISKYLLLGDKPSREKVTFFSNEDQVTPETPPTYLTQCEDDSEVKVENSIVFYEALIRNKVPAEMHLYPKGDHGFVLRLPPDEWLDPVLLWMKKGGWL
jgi:acetyl esterase/lipase